MVMNKCHDNSGWAPLQEKYVAYWQIDTFLKRHVCCLVKSMSPINSRNKPCFFLVEKNCEFAGSSLVFVENDSRLYGVNSNLKISKYTSVFYFEPTKWSSKSVFRVLGHQPSGYWLIRRSMLHFLLQYGIRKKGAIPSLCLNQA